jgi:hypothetical protein
MTIARAALERAGMDIGDWLRSLGLEKYEAVFRDNEIELDVLPEPTELDLEKLGLPLGPRKRLLKAIATLGADQKLGQAQVVPQSTRAPSGDGDKEHELRGAA